MKTSLFWRVFLGGLFVLPAVMLVFGWPSKALAEVTADHLVISEVQTSLGPGKTTHDFIELYNPTDAAIDLRGHRLVKRSKNSTSDTTIKSWTASTVVPAKGYYLWANSGYADLSSLADTTTSQTIADDNAVALRLGPEDTGEIIDAVAWGENAAGLAESANYAENIPANQSLQRILETNNNGADFQLQAVPAPQGASSAAEEPSSSETGETDDEPPSETTEDPENPPVANEDEDDNTPAGSTPASEPPPQIYLSEFLPNPKGADSGAEWVEVFNAGSVEVDLTGWLVDDEGAFLPGNSSFAFSETIAPKAYKAFLIPKGKFAINNNGDSVRLFAPGGLLQDVISYTGTAAEGQSFAKDLGGFWRWTAVPTPGTANQFISEVQPQKPEEKVKEEPEDKYAGVDVVFNEVFGNPKGADEGEEWVEFLNRSDKDYDLAGWFLDDEGKTVSGNAYNFPTGSVVPAGGLLAVKLPPKTFTITNTGDRLRLVSPDKTERTNIILQGFLENQTYARVEAGSQVWQWSLAPTFNEVNKFETPARNIVIAEVKLATGEELSAVILRNDESEWVDLSFWRLVLGKKEYVFPGKASIAPKARLMLDQETTGLNFTKGDWQTLELQRPEKEIQAKAEQAKLTSTAPPPAVAANSRSVTSQISLLPAPPALTNGIVAGEASEAPVLPVEFTDTTASGTQLPVVVRESKRRPFFHRVKGFFCGKLGFLLQCN